MGPPGGAGAAGGEQRDERGAAQPVGLGGIVNIAPESRHRGGDRRLPVLVQARPDHLRHRIAALALGGGVAGGGAPGGQLGLRLLLQAQHAGHVVAGGVNGAHGTAPGAMELLHVGDELAQPGGGHARIVGGHRHGPRVLQVRGPQAVRVEEVGADLVARQHPDEGRQGPPLLVPLAVGLGQRQARVDRQPLVPQGVRPGDGLGRQRGADRPPRVGGGQGEAFKDVVTSGHDAYPSGLRASRRAVSAT